MDAVRFLSERECPIHFSEFSVSATVPQRFCNDRERGELFRLGPIILNLGLHRRHSGCGLHTLNFQVQSSVPRSADLNFGWRAGVYSLSGIATVHLNAYEFDRDARPSS